MTTSGRCSSAIRTWYPADTVAAPTPSVTYSQFNQGPKSIEHIHRQRHQVGATQVPVGSVGAVRTAVIDMQHCKRVCCMLRNPSAEAEVMATREASSLLPAQTGATTRARSSSVMPQLTPLLYQPAPVHPHSSVKAPRESNTSSGSVVIALPLKFLCVPSGRWKQGSSIKYSTLLCRFLQSRSMQEQGKVARCPVLLIVQAL